MWRPIRVLPLALVLLLQCFTGKRCPSALHMVAALQRELQ
jgi:hypothetical protein